MCELTRVAPDVRARVREERLVALAERQHGVVNRHQLLAIGISGSTISRWEAARRLHRLYPSVYALGHGALDEEGRFRAALLYGRDGAVLSHLTAVAWWSLLDVQSGAIHLSTERVIASVRDVVVHHTTELEWVRHRGLPVTTAARTLLDVAPAIPFSRLRRALAEVEYQGLASLDEVAGVLRRGRPGSRALRRALALQSPQLARTLSVLEERFLALGRLN